MAGSFFLRNMKKTSVFIICVLLLFAQGLAQNKIGLDVAAIRNTQKPINGLNLSCFYYFSKDIAAGLEVDRFFPARLKSEDGDSEHSALDIEMNMHYLFSLHKGLHVYPVAGISHTTDREVKLKDGYTLEKSFLSINTGGGILWELGNWSPHLEYTFAWGPENQQFFLAGISYEIHLGRR
jgi:hypothetical protein